MSDRHLARIGLIRRPAQDRRKTRRLTASASVLIWSRGQGHATTLVDLSSGGAQVRGAWEPCPTDRVTVELPGTTSPLRVKGRVLRVIPAEARACQATVALKFLP